jgi:protein SCO1/2
MSAAAKAAAREAASAAATARLKQLALSLALALMSAFAHGATASQLAREVGVEQHPGRQLPLGTTLRDPSGDSVPLASFFGTRPVVLTFVYYRCPNLCNLTLTSLVRSLEHIDLTAGRDYEVIAISIDPRENSLVAAAKQASYVQQYQAGRVDCADCANGWHFLTAEASHSATLARAAGIRYFYDSSQDQYAHPAAALVVTPHGRIARYFNGIQFPPPELRWALMEAKGERTAGLADRFWLLCYHYEALAGRYTAVVQIAVRLLAIATVLVLGFLIFRLVRVP